MASNPISAQEVVQDTTDKKDMNMDAVYSRPFLTEGKLPVALGGYVEASTDYTATDGISDRLNFRAQRLTLFISSTIGKKLKFLSEIEFEDGTKEINIEFGALDMEFHPLFNLRGGIVMNPIGAFNQNHDGPKWDFVDRPIVSTTIIPSTFSNVGFGIHGKYFSRSITVGYEAYLTNGFNDKIIDNDLARTWYPAIKADRLRFEENNSGLPLMTGKIALRNRRVGEIGLSYMGGVYNKWQSEGLILDKKRWTHTYAIDFNTTLLHNKLDIRGEWVKSIIDVPDDYGPNYGEGQMGVFTDIMYTVMQKKVLDWSDAKVNVGVRLEYVDYNTDTFTETEDKIGDQLWAIVPVISFRPAGSTVVRLNYRYSKETDLLNNPPAHTASIQFGIATYF
jgi:hypothetical protein